MSMAQAQGQLQDAWHALEYAWHEATKTWDDPVRWSFEAEFYKPLQRDISTTIMAMERLGMVLHQAEQEVH